MIIESWIFVAIGLQIFTKISGSYMETTDNGTTAAPENLNWTEIGKTEGTPTAETERTMEVTTATRESKSTCECGVLEGNFPTGKIVGGTPVYLGRNQFWPWVATLVHESRPTLAHCGASLISPRYILTAGHCVLPMLQYGLKNFQVKLGYNDLLEEENPNAMNVKIESALVHPEFEQADPYHFDIGLVKLSHPVRCTQQVHPICLPSSSSFPSAATAITTGFGRTGINENYSQKLLQIEINMISNEECRQHFSKLWYKAPAIMDNMMCAWSQGKDSCVGDSGSSLFVLREANESKINHGYYEQVGVTSWGIGCANNYPGVYAKIKEFLPWIRSIAIDLPED